MIFDNLPQRKPRITYLKTGDTAWVVNSMGEHLGTVTIERETNFHVIAEGKKYWKKGIDGKHRYNGNYTIYLMREEDAIEFLSPLDGIKREIEKWKFPKRT